MIQGIVCSSSFYRTASKWSYKEVEDDDAEKRDSPRTGGLLPKSHWYSSVRFQMTGFASLGVAAAILHHFFYYTMNGRHVITYSLRLRRKVYST